MAKLKVQMKIGKAIMELPDTKTIRLEWPEGYEIDFLTGQFITVYWSHKQKYKRAYSLSSCALDKGYYEVTVPPALFAPGSKELRISWVDFYR